MIEWNNIPEGVDLSEWHSFVYEINLLDGSGHFYIGKKQLFSISKRPPLKGRKNKRHVKKESDWRKYTGSSTELNDLITEGVPYEKNMLVLVKGKWAANYYELKEQMRRDVLFDEKSLNGIINVRIGKAPANAKDILVLG